MKVICGICTYNHAPLLQDYLRYLNRLEPNFDKYLFFENNSQDDTLEVIQQFNRSKELIRLWFRDDAIKILGNPYGIIGLARQYILERARKINPDYLFLIDDDITIFYPHFIEQIIGRKKDLVGAPYLRSFPEGVFLASKWKRKGKKKLWFKSSCTGFQEVHVTSAGCMCLSRKIIQDRRVNFLPIMWNGHKASEDFGYCLRAHKYGYKVYLDCELRVGHYADAYGYKPWFIKRDKKGETKGYIDFEYGQEEKIIKEIIKI